MPGHPLSRAEHRSLRGEATTYILLVNWNGCRDTLECLESLLRLDSDHFGVVVIDNGSTDGSQQVITDWARDEARPRPSGPPWSRLPHKRKRDPSMRCITLDREPMPAPDGSWLTFIAAGENLGFGAANNIGMRFAARDPQARYFWILNNDTVVSPAALEAFVAHAEAHPAHGLIGGTLLYYHRPDFVQGFGGWTLPARCLAGHIGFETRADQPPPLAEIEARLAYVMGASMFARRDVFDRIGGMPEDYFLYFEELDWAKRLPADLRQGFCPGAVVYHKEGGTIGTASGTVRPSDTSIYYYTANTLRYAWRHERRHLLAAILRVTWNGVRFVRNGDWRAARVVARAVLDVVTGHRRRGGYPGVEFHTRALPKRSLSPP